MHIANIRSFGHAFKCYENTFWMLRSQMAMFHILCNLRCSFHFIHCKMRRWSVRRNVSIMIMNWINNLRTRGHTTLGSIIEWHTKTNCMLKTHAHALHYFNHLCDFDKRLNFVDDLLPPFFYIYSMCVSMTKCLRFFFVDYQQNHQELYQENKTISFALWCKKIT